MGGTESARIADNESREKKKPPDEGVSEVKMTDSFTLRMLGNNVSLYRSGWLELLADLNPGCALAGRISAMLADDRRKDAAA